MITFFRKLLGLHIWKYSLAKAVRTCDVCGEKQYCTVAVGHLRPSWRTIRYGDWSCK